MLLVIRKTVEGLNWMCAQTLAGATAAAAATRVKLVKFIHMLRKNCLEKLQTGINKFSLSHPHRRLSLSRIAWSIFSASLFSSNFGGKHSTPTLQTECHILIFPNFSRSPYFFHFSFAWFVCCRNVCFNILCYKIASGGCELSVDAAYVFPTGFRFARIAGIRLFWFVVFIILLFLLCIMYDYYHHSRTKMPANGSPLCACVRVRCVSPQFTNFASHKLLLFENLLWRGERNSMH